MSEAMIPKNGLPCFDATGNMSMVSRNDLQSSLGFVRKLISYTRPVGNDFGIILLSDIGAWPCSTGFLHYGFAGLVYKYNTGHVYGGFGMGLVNAVACYEVTANGVCLNSTQQYIIPVVVKYNGHCYVGIKVFGNTGHVHLIGYGYNLLDTPIVLNNRDNMNKADAEILFEAEAFAVGGG